MRISEQWLRAWVAATRTLDEIAEGLTMAGLEVDAIDNAAPSLDGVVVGRIEQCTPHPEADRLQVCAVDIGAGEDLTIVCGAPNARAGLVAPVATVGTTLGNGIEIVETTLRGVASRGMLASAKELGLAADAQGLWALDSDAAPGTPLVHYLALPDRVLEIDLTPNRGDCLSLRGVAREVAVAEDCAVTPPDITTPAIATEVTRAVRIDAPERCAGYAARCVNAVDPGRAAPVWMRERLRRAGIRSINLPVDVGNYVMLELGQPMHAFDADKLVGAITVRLAAPGEHIVTLDGEQINLDADTLVIADEQGPAAIAGMIGGQRTAVDENTVNIVFESACFTPAAVAGQGRRYKIHTDALHRFERGVDPRLYPRAIERAAALLVAHGGGDCGPVTDTAGQAPPHLQREIALASDHVARLLGQAIADDEIARILAALGIEAQPQDAGRWHCRPPSWRYDLEIEADLIEEVARVHGYDRLESRSGGVSLPPVRPETLEDDEAHCHAVLRQRGYSEAITYSFVEPELHGRLTDRAPAVVLDNPISDQLVEMRHTIWASLLPSWQYNVRRQQPTVRLFETGLVFRPDERAEHGVAQCAMLAGLATGDAGDTHWDAPARPVDFFDVKGDVEALLAPRDTALAFEAACHPALHPGRSARIVIDGETAGWLGQLSPEFNKILKNKEMPYVFEIDYNYIRRPSTIRFQAVPEQPSVRRDLAALVAEALPVADLIAAVRSVEASELQSIEVFDVFRGEGFETGFKSVALGLIFQDKASTLTDERVDTIITGVIAALRAQCGARIRGE